MIMKMKQLVIASIILINLITLNTLSLAQDPVPANNSFLDQNGPNNVVDIQQTFWGNTVAIFQETNGPLNSVTIKQHSAFNSAEVQQNHDDNEAPQESYIEQIGSGNNVATQIQGKADPSLKGCANSSWIKQDGGENIASQEQTGRDKTTSILQNGNNNNANQIQTSETGSDANITQNGNNLQAEQTQSGLADFLATSFDFKHQASVVQEGSAQNGNQLQSGIQHFSGWLAIKQRINHEIELSIS